MTSRISRCCTEILSQSSQNAQRVCVYVYVYMYTHTHIHAHTCTHMHTRAHTRARTHTYAIPRHCKFLVRHKARNVYHIRMRACVDVCADVPVSRRSERALPASPCPTQQQGSADCRSALSWYRIFKFSAHTKRADFW